MISNDAFDLSIELLKVHEYLRLKPYRDTVGKLTIGYGRNLEDDGITESEAGNMLLHDIDMISEELEKRIPFFTSLNDVRQAVLIDMAYNMGIHGLMEFTNMLQCIEKGDYVTASLAMLQSKWASEVGRRAADLSDLMTSGRADESS